MGYKLKRATIWMEKKWQPGANTVAYYKLKSDTNDATGTYNLTNDGITFTSLGGVACANFNGSTTSATGNFYSYGTGDFTASVWGRPTSNSQGIWWIIGSNTLVMNSKNGYVEGTSAPTPLNTWTNIVFTITGGKLKIYSNGTLYLDTNFSNNVTGTLRLGRNEGGALKFSGGLSELIFENVARTQQEVTNYYNITKGDYGYTPEPILEEKQVRPASTQTVQTFDFQNNGNLNWTGISFAGTPNYVSGQGWSIGTSSVGAYQAPIMPPSSVYNGEILKKWKLRVYKPDATTSSNTAGGGMGTNDFSGGLVCCHQQKSGITYCADVYDGSSDHLTEVSEFTGEATLEYNLNDDGSLTLSINGGTEYNLGNFSTQFRNNWTNNNLGLCIGRWNSGAFYIRKLEITTA